MWGDGMKKEKKQQQTERKRTSSVALMELASISWVNDRLMAAMHRPRFCCFCVFLCVGGEEGEKRGSSELDEQSRRKKARQKERERILCVCMLEDARRA